MNTEQPVAVEIDAVSKVFGTGAGRVTALDHVSLTVAENEFFTLLGPSGCGKTTLLRLIAGFEHSSAGSIRLYGEEIAHLPPYRRPVNTVFQNYALFPHMTVAENIGFGLSMLDRPSAEIKTTVEKMLALVKMEPLAARRTDQISGGQQQRVALARALAPQPRVLLLDEPLSALDYKLRKEMQIELKRLQHETGITFIFVTHDQEEALTMSDRLAVMHQGRILQTGSPFEIYQHPQSRFVADFIGDTNFLDGALDVDGQQQATLRLAGGEHLALGILSHQSSVSSATVAVRPEHASIDAAPVGTDGLRGQIENVVYSGTDTHIHVRLAGGQPFVVRIQNRGEWQQRWQVAQTVSIRMDPGSVQLLGD